LGIKIFSRHPYLFYGLGALWNRFTDACRAIHFDSDFFAFFVAIRATIAVLEHVAFRHHFAFFALLAILALFTVFTFFAIFAILALSTVFAVLALSAVFTIFAIFALLAVFAFLTVFVAGRTSFALIALLTFFALVAHRSCGNHLGLNGFIFLPGFGIGAGGINRQSDKDGHRHHAHN
jgi:hypothetical protein